MCSLRVPCVRFAVKQRGDFHRNKNDCDNKNEQITFEDKYENHPKRKVKRSLGAITNSNMER